MNYRNYIYVTEGKISIQLIPPSAGKYLRGEKDYDNFEFRSPMNPWEIQDESGETIFFGFAFIKDAFNIFFILSLFFLCLIRVVFFFLFIKIPYKNW